jgi:hypothetical protein
MLNSRRCFRISLLVSLFSLFVLAQPASAQEESEMEDPAAGEPEAPPPAPKEKIIYGAAVKVRGIFIPKGEIELFLQRAESGVVQPGFGVDFVRRHGDFEITAGIGYDKLAPDDGIYWERGAELPANPPDDVVFDGFSWVTFEVNFLWHYPLSGDMLALRYGAGLGLGVLLGDILQTDTICQGTDVDTCVRNPNGLQVDDPAGKPPVFPVVNLIGGLQVRPTPKLSLNVEVGLRTAFFAGLSAGYFF